MSDKIEFSKEQIEAIEALRNKVVNKIHREVDPLRQSAITIHNIFNEFIGKRKEDVEYFAKQSMRSKKDSSDFFN